jgi:hypothetical protein
MNNTPCEKDFRFQTSDSEAEGPPAFLFSLDRAGAFLWVLLRAQQNGARSCRLRDAVVM